jgi:hypothetical protein
MRLKGTGSVVLGRMRFLATVAKSLSRVWKLWCHLLSGRGSCSPGECSLVILDNNAIRTFQFTIITPGYSFLVDHFCIN